MSSEESEGPPPKKQKAGAPAWMVTYSDLVTLLLTFFVLLLSMANMDPVRFVSASVSIKKALGVNADAAPSEYNIPVMQSVPIVTFSPIVQDTSKKVHEKIKNQIASLRISDQVDLVKKDGDVIILRLSDSILFKKGQSEISPNSYLLLRNIADIIRPLPVLARIEGHSDDNPGEAIMTNWNVSAERAVSVMRFLHRSKLLELDRMSAVGYADSKPVVPNSNDEQRAKNRRVDFVLKLKPPEKVGPSDSSLPL